jgi:hypothetical protein
MIPGRFNVDSGKMAVMLDIWICHVCFSNRYEVWSYSCIFSR